MPCSKVTPPLGQSASLSKAVTWVKVLFKATVSLTSSSPAGVKPPQAVVKMSKGADNLKRKDIANLLVKTISGNITRFDGKVHRRLNHISH